MKAMKKHRVYNLCVSPIYEYNFAKTVIVVNTDSEHYIPLSL